MVEVADKDQDLLSLRRPRVSQSQRDGGLLHNSRQVFRLEVAEEGCRSEAIAGCLLDNFLR